MSEEIVQNRQLEEEGAPAWVATFGDLMSFLLCFFVLLLPVFEMDRAKYKEVTGSLANAFGVQRKVKAFQTPKGVKMIARDFDQPLIPAGERDGFAENQQRQEVEEKLKKAIETRFQEMQDMIQVEVGPVR
jgi:chemotaxis protein MotB